MENASKALIIAGAILLSILIIGIGMMIYQQAADQISDTGLDQQSISTFNQQFLNYEGTKSGTQARALCDLIKNNNLTNADSGAKIINIDSTESECTGAVNATLSTTAEEAATQAQNATTLKAYLKTGHKYKITFDYAKSGIIAKIGIKDVTT